MKLERLGSEGVPKRLGRSLEQGSVRRHHATAHLVLRQEIEEVAGFPEHVPPEAAKFTQVGPWTVVGQDFIVLPRVVRGARGLLQDE
jgi:hypothetical protein